MTLPEALNEIVTSKGTFASRKLRNLPEQDSNDCIAKALFRLPFIDMRTC